MNRLNSTDFQQKIKELIDSLKGICASYGLGNDGNEFKIITQVFLYKFSNDKFAYEIKQIDPKIAKAESWTRVLKEMPEGCDLNIIHLLSSNRKRPRPSP